MSTDCGPPRDHQPMTAERLETMLRDALCEHLALSDVTETEQPSVTCGEGGVVLRFADGTEYAITITRSR